MQANKHMWTNSSSIWQKKCQRNTETQVVYLKARVWKVCGLSQSIHNTMAKWLYNTLCPLLE